VFAPAPGTGAVFREPLATFADKTDKPGRIPNDQPGHVAGDDGAGPDHGEPTYRHTGEDGASTPDGRALLDHDPRHHPIGFGFQPPVEPDRPRSLVVQETGVGADQNTWSDTAAFENGHAHLQLRSVSNDNIRVEVDTLTKDAVSTDSHAFADLRLVPDLGTRANDS